MSVRNLLSQEDFDLFEKQFPEKSVEDLKKIQKNIIIIYTKTVSISKDLIEKGFNEDFKNINIIEWVSFISKIIPVIEELKGLKTGKDKLDLLVSYSVFLIIVSLPIDPFLKELLIKIIKDSIPSITKSIINTSQEIHTFLTKIPFLKKIHKGLKKLFSCPCILKQEEK